MSVKGKSMNSIEFTNVKNKITENSIFMIFYVTQLIAVFLHMTLNIYWSLLYFIASLVPNVILILRKKISKRTLILFLMVLLVLCLFGMLGNTPINVWGLSFLTGLNAFLLSILLLQQRTIKILILMLYLMNIFVFYKGYSSGFNIDFGNNILHDRSRNYVSAVLLLFSVHYVFLCRIYSKRIDLFLLLFLLLNSIILFGRTGVFFSAILFIFALYLESNKALFLLILITIFPFLGALGYYIISETNFGMGLESPRSALLSEYLNYALESSKTILFGPDLSKCCSLIAAYDYNPHNSFAMSHSVFGIFSILISILMAFFIFLTGRIDVIFLFLIIFFRYYFDNIGFFSYYDIPLFTIVIFCYTQITRKFFD